MRKEREPAAWLLCFRLSSCSWEKGARVHGNIPAAAEPRRPNETASDTHASTHGTAHTLASEQEQGPFCSYLHCGVKKAPLFLNQIVPLRYFIININWIWVDPDRWAITMRMRPACNSSQSKQLPNRMCTVCSSCVRKLFTSNCKPNLDMND